MTYRIFLLIGLLFAFSIAGCSQKANSNTEKANSNTEKANSNTEKANSNTEPLQVGATAPDFTLSSNKNEQITLSNINKPTVLVFYRGYW